MNEQSPRASGLVPEVLVYDVDQGLFVDESVQVFREYVC